MLMAPQTVSPNPVWQISLWLVRQMLYHVSGRSFCWHGISRDSGIFSFSIWTLSNWNSEKDRKSVSIVKSRWPFFPSFSFIFYLFFFLKAAFYCTARFCLVKKKLSGVFEGKNVKILLAPITIYFFSPWSIRTNSVF